jgi:hypothetical protein
MSPYSTSQNIINLVIYLAPFYRNKLHFVQLKLLSINGIRVSLAEWDRFRKIFKSKATEIGVRGYICWETITDAVVEATGSKALIKM